MHDAHTFMNASADLTLYGMNLSSACTLMMFRYMCNIYNLNIIIYFKALAPTVHVLLRYCLDFLLVNEA